MTRTPWPVLAAGMCLWAVAVAVTVVTVAADRLVQKFVTGR